MANILVTGGAGYIGSHTCKLLAAGGHTPIVYDNLSNGHRDAVRWGPFEAGEMTDGARLRAVIRAHRPHAVIHFAGLIEVALSVADPAAFYHTNVAGSLALLRAMTDEGVRTIVFSSREPELFSRLQRGSSVSLAYVPRGTSIISRCW